MLRKYWSCETTNTAPLKLFNASISASIVSVLKSVSKLQNKKYNQYPYPSDSLAPVLNHISNWKQNKATITHVENNQMRLALGQDGKNHAWLLAAREKPNLLGRQISLDTKAAQVCTAKVSSAWKKNRNCNRKTHRLSWTVMLNRSTSSWTGVALRSSCSTWCCANVATRNGVGRVTTPAVGVKVYSMFFQEP